MRTAKARPASSRSIRQRVSRILSRLHQAMPNAKVELNHRNPLELLIATILSAQCTDQRVNEVTPALFRRYTNAADYAKADPSELETIIMPTGFYKSKTRSLIGTGRMLLERFGGKVPQTMEELVQLPGVGRKTANVLLGNCFDQPAVVVDTHVKRVAHRLGLTQSQDPEVIEQDLQRVMPLDEWTSGSERLLLHGRYICVAKRPKCEQCAIYSDCSWEGKRPR
ncbi:endonuclease III [Nitrospira sp. Nam74]